MSLKITAKAIEIALIKHFDYQRNLIIPNVFWGFRNLNYEIDLLVVTTSNFAYEVEIKVSPGDLRKDQEKHKWRYCREQHYFRKSYFAIPESMLKYQDLVPEHAGIIVVSYNEKRAWFDAKEVKHPEIDNFAKKVNDEELIHLGKLATLRMWNLKRKLLIEKRAEVAA